MEVKNRIDDYFKQITKNMNSIFKEGRDQLLSDNCNIRALDIIFFSNERINKLRATQNITD